MTIGYSGTTFPLDLSSLSLLEQTDRGVYSCLMFCKAVLEGYLGARFAQVISAKSISLFGNPDGYVVGDMVPFDPSPFMDQGQLSFPVLSLERGHSDYFEHSNMVPAVRGRWTLRYILPALSLASYSFLQPFLNGVEKVLASRIPLGKDPFYTAEDTWGTNAGVATCKLVSSDVDMWTLSKEGASSGKDILFPILTMTLEVVEHESAPNTTPFSGVDASINAWDGIDGYEDTDTIVSLEVDL